MIGGDVATLGLNVNRAILNLTTRSLTTLAFVLRGDEDCIYVGHSAFSYPSDPLEATPFGVGINPSERSGTVIHRS